MIDSSLGEMVKAAMAGVAERGAPSGAGQQPEPEPIASDALYKLADAVEHVSKSLLEPDSGKRTSLKAAAGLMEPGKGPGSLAVSEHTGAGGPPATSTGAAAAAPPKATGNGTMLGTNESDEKRAGALYARNRRVAERLKKAAEAASPGTSQAALVASNKAAIDATKKDVKRVPTKEVNELFRAEAMKDSALQQAFGNCGVAGVKTAAVKAEAAKTAGARALLSDLVVQVERHREGSSSR